MDVRLRPGAYAIVRCHGESFFRALKTDPARLGEACGHAGLAAEHPVLFAAEVVLDGEMTIIHWSSVSVTYQIPDSHVVQSGLPISQWWRLMMPAEVDAYKASGMKTVHPLPSGYALHISTKRSVSDR